MKLVFVYNADSGLFNTLTDIAHKLLSPDTYPCQLCAITHGAFRERDEWRNTLEDLDAECEFLHRDGFFAAYPDADTELPAIFVLRDHGLKRCLSRDQINEVHTVKELKALLEEHCFQGAHRCPG